MTLIGDGLLTKFAKGNVQAAKPIQAWLVEALAAQWKTPQDIKARFHYASFLARNRVIFNVGGNSYRLATKVDYLSGLVRVDWIGTHAEYDKLSL